VGHHSVAPPSLTELARVEAILARMAPADQAVFAPLVLPKSVLSRRRRVLRDERIRAARRYFPDSRITYAARGLERALLGHALSNWRWEKDVDALPDSASGYHQALHGILRANNGKSLGERRLVDVFNAMQ
jgi:hypothetical protein